MYRFEFYNNLDKFKANSLQHNSEYGKQHYAKIDKYYPDGRARYFWTKEEWEAYQRDKGQDEYRKQQAQKKVTSFKTTVDRAQEQINKNYENKLKDKKKENDYNKNQQADVQKKIDEILENNQNGLTRKEVYKIDDIITKSNEGKEAINLYEKMIDEYNGVYPLDKAQEMKELIEEKINSVYNFDKSDINSDILNHVADELINKAKEKWRVHNSGKIRDNEIKKAQDKARKEKEAEEAARIAPITDAIDEIRHSHNDNKTFDRIYDTLAEWRKNEEIDPETGLPLINYELNPEDDLKLVNPGYRYEEHSTSGDMTEDEVTGYHNNCFLATVACVLRERGYDVSAGTDLNGVRVIGFLFNEFEDIFTNITTSIFDFTNIKDLKSEMNSLPPGTYGQMSARWKEGGGHSTFFKVDDKGKLHIYDGQTGYESGWEHYEKYAKSGRYYVLNDAEIDLDYVKKNKMIIY